MDYKRWLEGYRYQLAMDRKILGKYATVDPSEQARLQEAAKINPSIFTQQNEQAPEVVGEVTQEATNSTLQNSLSAEERSEKLQNLARDAMTCEKCELSQTRNTVVFGSGSFNADLVIVGEAPGYHEDLRGFPFVGQAGELLTKMLAAIQLPRQDVYICNVIKCRPPNNRDPKAEEILQCQEWFHQQLKLLEPKLLLALGKFASGALTGEIQSMWKYRGKIYSYNNIPVICSYHPAYLLRNNEEKKKAWQDLKKVRAFLESTNQG